MSEVSLMSGQVLEALRPRASMRTRSTLITRLTQA
jgi:hypothetical protein